MADLRLGGAFVAVIVRYLTTIRADAHGELARWRLRACAIPDPGLRCHVLEAFDSDMSAEGAAIFAVLQPRHRRELVPLLVAYALLWSAVDAATDRESGAHPELLNALVDALRPGVPTGEHLHAADDSGYVADLVAACRSCCAALPSWHIVEPAAVAIAQHGRAVQATNHERSADVAANLRSWATETFPSSRMPWFELSAAATGPLAIHAIIPLAADPATTPLDAAQTARAYFPSASALSVLADHFIDARRDAGRGAHNYMTYYDQPHDVASALERLVVASTRDARSVKHGRRHAVILAAMVAMFFSDPAVERGADARAAAAVLRAAGGPARCLSAIVRVMRRLDRSHSTA